MTDYAIVGTKIKSIRNPNVEAILSGALSIKGMVSEVNFPIPCRVRLFEKISGRLIADIATDAQGNYEFKNLARVPFFLIAHHPASQFNAVIQDNVVPK